MTAKIIDGKAVAKRVRAEVALGVAQFRCETGISPGLAVVRIGEDPASLAYVSSKRKSCAEVGIAAEEHYFQGTAAENQVVAKIESLNENPQIHGILIQLPLPQRFDFARVVAAVAPWKDVDGLHPVNMGNLALGRPGLRPCTPLGVMRLLEEIGFDPRGKCAVVIGRSQIVGKPIAMLLLAADATVVQCHSKTTDLPYEIGRGDLVVAAVGKAALVCGDWMKDGAVVIDVGTNRNAEGKLVGDVDFAAAAQRCSAITPVPGGVGPMTVAMLLANTLTAAQNSKR